MRDMVVDYWRMGEPSLFQTNVDMTQVDAPLSIIHRCTTKFRIDTEIWKVIVDGILGSPLSKSKVINLESEGSTAPSAANNDFR